MLKELRIENFKSWRDTGKMRLGAITGLFGTNSSGKSSILQFLLLLKQTVESTDTSRVLDTGDGRSYVALGTFRDFIHHHEIERLLNFSLTWQTRFEEAILLTFRSSISGQSGGRVEHFIYSTVREEFGVKRNTSCCSLG